MEEVVLTQKELKDIEDAVEKLLSLLDIEGTFEVIPEKDRIDILLETKDSGMVIGYHGEVLESLQLIFSLIISKQINRFYRISIEVDGYKKNRTEYLEKLAITTKEKVLEGNSEQTLFSLKPWSEGLFIFTFRTMNRLPRSQGEKEKKGFSLSNPKPDLERFTFYLIILLIPTQFGKHFWPSFSQILGIRVDYLSPAIYLTDLLIFLLLLFWFKNQNTIKLLLPSQSINIVYILFIASIFIGTLISGNLSLSFYGIAKLLELLLFGIYIAKNIKSKNDFQKIALITAVSVSVISMIAIAQYIHQGSLNGIFYFLGERKFTASTPGIANASINGELILRPYSTFPHPNVLAGYLLCGLILIYTLVNDKGKILLSIIKNSALWLGSIALLLTLSRVAIIIWSLLVASILINKLIKLTIKKSRMILAGTLLLSILLIVGIINLTPAYSRLEGSRLTELALTQRVALIKNTISMIGQHPLLGVGLYSYLPNLSLIQKPEASAFYIQPVHNIFLLLLAETGIIGFSFFILFLFKTYKRLINSCNSSRSPLLIAITVILILGLFDHYWLTLQQGQLLLALVLGLSWAF